MIRAFLLNFVKNVGRDRNLVDGERLEKYASDMFPPASYDLIHKSHDNFTNAERYVLSSLKPDFQFSIKRSSVTFWVEVKLRNNQSNSSVIYPFKDGQLERYKSYKNCFLLLCTYYNSEEIISLIPFDHIKWDKLFISFIQKYRIEDDIISPKLVLDFIR